MKGTFNPFPALSASAIWEYLNQPLFQTHTHFILNPLKFTHSYRIRFLETCWTANYQLAKKRELLEACWRRPAITNQNCCS